MQKNIILVLGPQGSGKSTQAKLLAEHLSYTFVSTGNLIRKKTAEQDAEAQTIREYMLKGDLVPDALVEGLLFPFLEVTPTAGFILDGYPRSMTQLDTFLQFLSQQAWKLDRVFFLSVSQQECIHRMKLRAEIEKREDETDEAITERLHLYHVETEPLLTRYEQLQVLIRVDGERSVEDIQAEIRTYYQSV